MGESNAQSVEAIPGPHPEIGMEINGSESTDLKEGYCADLNRVRERKTNSEPFPVTEPEGPE
jgi:hypothetical protein